MREANRSQMFAMFILRTGGIPTEQGTGQHFMVYVLK